MRAGDDADFLTISEESEGEKIGSSELDGVPFEYDGGLGSIAAAQDGNGGLLSAERRVDRVLKGAEGVLGGGFGGGIATDGDVDDGAGGDVGREENGGELDQSLIRGQEYRDACVDLANGQGNEHLC